MTTQNDDDRREEGQEGEPVEEVREAAEEAQEAGEEARAAPEEELVAVAAVEDEEPRIKPQTTTLTIVLCALNVLAVLAFAVLLVLDLGARKQWAYNVFRFDLHEQGLPLREDSNSVSTMQAAVTQTTLEPQWLKQAYDKRRGNPVSEPFRRAVNPSLQVIRPEDLSADLLQEMFASHGGNPPRTLEDEVEWLENNLPSKIEAGAAGGPEAKTEAEKRQLLRQRLWPLVYTTRQIEDLDRAILSAKADELDQLLVEAYQRRLYADLLTLLEIHRPRASQQEVPKELKDLSQVAALDPKAAGPLAERFVVKLTDLNGWFMERLNELKSDNDPAGNKRSADEKRRTIGLLLLALTRLKTADGQPLYSQGRAEVVLGTREFTQAADTLALVYGELEKRFLAAIARDRGPYVYPLESYVNTPAAFAEKVTEVCKRLQITIPNEKAFTAAVEQTFQAFLDKKSQLKKSSDVVSAVRGVLKSQGVVITGDKDDAGTKVPEATFEAEIANLVDQREPGFLGKYQEAIVGLRELKNRIDDRRERLKELQAQEQALQQQYEVREKHEREAIAKLLRLREESLQLALDEQRLQDELFRAQVELSNAREYNQLLQRRILELELGKGGGER